jgi:hypothetical protein
MNKLTLAHHYTFHKTKQNRPGTSIHLVETHRLGCYFIEGRSGLRTLKSVPFDFVVNKNILPQRSFWAKPDSKDFCKRDLYFLYC